MHDIFCACYETTTKTDVVIVLWSWWRSWSYQSENTKFNRFLGLLGFLRPCIVLLLYRGLNHTKYKKVTTTFCNMYHVKFRQNQFSTHAFKVGVSLASSFFVSGRFSSIDSLWSVGGLNNLSLSGVGFASEYCRFHPLHTFYLWIV